MSSSQTVVVTGGGSGIGAALALHYATKGHRVIIADINNDALTQDTELSQTTKDNIQFVYCNVADEASVTALFTTTSELFHGQLDVLINCVGIAGPTAALENISLEDWQKTFNLNVTSTFLCCKQAIPLLKNRAQQADAKARPSIINFSSTAGSLGYPNRSPYCASKWAIVGLTKTLAMELGPFNIRVNAIAPGSVEGARMQSVIDKESQITGTSQEQVRKRYLQFTSLSTFVHAQEIAHNVEFLTSEFSNSVTAQIIHIDGNCQTLM